MTRLERVKIIIIIIITIIRTTIIIIITIIRTIIIIIITIIIIIRRITIIIIIIIITITIIIIIIIRITIIIIIIIITIITIITTITITITNKAMAQHLDLGFCFFSQRSCPVVRIPIQVFGARMIASAHAIPSHSYINGKGVKKEKQRESVCVSE